MIHYHGGPIHPDDAASIILHSGHAMVSHAHPFQIGLVQEVCQSHCLDNGAFSAWRSGKPVKDWSGYLEWSVEAMTNPGCDWCIIPDVIDGDELANDRLEDWFLMGWARFRPDAVSACVPVWHMHESYNRLRRLAAIFRRVAIGSSGQFATIGTSAWWNRIIEGIRQISDQQGRPRVKLHGLRMLDPAIFSKLPFSSADSTAIARNIGMDSKWRSGGYRPPTKAARGVIMRQRIESHGSSRVIGQTPSQRELFEAQGSGVGHG